MQPSSELESGAGRRQPGTEPGTEVVPGRRCVSAKAQGTKDSLRLRLPAGLWREGLVPSALSESGY